MRREREGLTIVEALIAIVVLGVGIVSLVQLQATALRSTALAEQIRTVTQVAEAELEWRRHTALDSVDCVSFRPEWISDCSVATSRLGTNAFLVTVYVAGREAEVELSTFRTGQLYVGGLVSDMELIADEEGDVGDADGGHEDDPGVDAPCLNPNPAGICPGGPG